MGGKNSSPERTVSNDPTTTNRPDLVTVSNLVRNASSTITENIPNIPTTNSQILNTPSNTVRVEENTNMAGEKEDIESKLKKLNLKGRKEINILLLGETGVGKSTFINSVFNYLQFADFQTAEKEHLNVLIPSSFVVYDKEGTNKFIEVGSKEDSNESLDVGASATQGVKTYSFRIQQGQTMVRLIDTPGMGDTRGIEQDNMNCENILNYLSRIHELHAICYLYKPQQSRATAYFKYCVAQIMSRLEKSACHNIIFVFTNSKSSNFSPGDTFLLLKQMVEEISANQAQAKIPLEKNMFCFDNEAFRTLAAIKNGVKFQDDVRRDSIKSWKKSTEQCWNMIEYILDLKPHFVRHTSAINEARRIIYQLAQPMADIAQLVNDNIYVLRNHEAYLNIDRQSLSELKKRLYIPVIDLEVTNLTQPVTVCADSACAEIYKVGDRNEWHYKTRCHDPCYLTNVTKEIMGDPALINCASMDTNQICKKCAHSYRQHMHVYYMTKKKHSQKEDDVVLENINTKELVIDNALRIIRGVRQRKEKLEKELNVIVKCNAKFAHFLQNNAIAPFSDSYAEYINHLIIKERGLGSNADITKMAGLEKLLREHNEMKKIFSDAAKMQKILGKDDDVTPQDINNSMQELFKLELNGKKIKELYESQKKSINREHNYTEYVHKGTFSKSDPNTSKKNQDKGNSSKSNPTTKFQPNRQVNRGNQNNNRGNQNNNRGRSNNPQNRNQNRNRTPPPPYDSTHDPQRTGYPSATYDRGSQGYPGYPQHPQGAHASYPPPLLGHPPYPPSQGVHTPFTPPPSQPTVIKNPEEKGPSIQVHVTLPTPPADNLNNNPPRDNRPRDYPHPDPYRDYPRDYPPRDYPRDYPSGDYPRDYPPRDYPPRDYPPRDPNYPPRDYRDSPPGGPNYPPRSYDYPSRDPNYPPPPRDYNYPPRDNNYPPRYHPADNYTPRQPNYPPPGNDYHHRDPRYDQRYPSTSQYPPNPPPQGPSNTNQGSGNYQQNQNRRGHDNRGGYRGRGNRGGINRRYRKKNDNANANANSGDESDTSVASSKK